MLSQRFGLGLTHRFLTYCLSSLDISDVSRILADFFAAANEFQKFSGVYGGRIFFGGFSAVAKISADPDIRRRPGSLADIVDFL